MPPAVPTMDAPADPQQVIEMAARRMERAGNSGAAATLRRSFASIAAAATAALAGTLATGTTASASGGEHDDCGGECWPEARETINCAYRQADITDCIKERIIDDESTTQIELPASPDPLKPGEWIVDIPTPRMASTLELDTLRVTGDVGAGEVSVTNQVTGISARGVMTMQNADGDLVKTLGRKSQVASTALEILAGRCNCKGIKAQQTAYDPVQLRLKLTNPQPDPGSVTVYLDARRTWAEDCIDPETGARGVPLYTCGVPVRCGQPIYVPQARQDTCPTLAQQIQTLIVENPEDAAAAAQGLIAALGGFATSEPFFLALYQQLTEIGDNLGVTPLALVLAIIAGGYDAGELIGQAFDTLGALPKIATMVSLFAQLNTDGDRFSVAQQVFEAMPAVDRIAFFTLRSNFAYPGTTFDGYFGATWGVFPDNATRIAYIVAKSIAWGGTFAADLKAALP